MSNVHQAIWKSTEFDLKRASYAGLFGRPARSVGRRIPYNDYEAKASIIETIKNDIKYGISTRQALGMEV